jgi:hypothetical protein
MLIKDDMNHEDEALPKQKERPPQVANFEIFESSSEEELSQGAFESVVESL